MLSAMLIVVFRKSGGDIALAARAAISVCVGIAVIGMLAPIAEFITSLFELCGTYLPPKIIGTMLKTLAVAFLCHICASVCRDLGEGSIASYIELGGKVEMLMLSLPLIEDAVGTVIKILDMV